jgi:hypothetical protein
MVIDNCPACRWWCKAARRRLHTGVAPPETV